MSKNHLRLQATEQAIAQAAAQIYAAYITTGRVEEGEESSWMKRSIKEAILIARSVDDSVISENEVDSDFGDGISMGRG